MKLFRSKDWPKGLAIEMIEYELYIGMRLFRENFETFHGIDKQHIAGLVGNTIQQIRNLGIPCYLEVVKGDGRNARGGLAH